MRSKNNVFKDDEQLEFKIFIEGIENSNIPFNKSLFIVMVMNEKNEIIPNIVIKVDELVKNMSFRLFIG